ncbi:unnamed protein product [Camellia sinensis]
MMFCVGDFSHKVTHYIRFHYYDYHFIIVHFTFLSLCDVCMCQTNNFSVELIFGFEMFLGAIRTIGFFFRNYYYYFGNLDQLECLFWFSMRSWFGSIDSFSYLTFLFTEFSQANPIHMLR